MGAQALPQPRPFAWRRSLLVLALVLGLAAIGAAIAGYVWLRGYEPLGSGSFYGLVAAQGVMVRAAQGSDGADVFFLRYRPNATFQLAASVANHGRIPVTIVGLGSSGLAPGTFQPVRAEVSPPNQYGTNLSPLDRTHPVRLKPGEERAVAVTYRLASRCIGGQPAGYWKQGVGGAAVSGFRSAWFRIRYAWVFEKTQQYTFPFAVTLVCRNGVTAPG
jgi:hypothetical protein